MLNALARLVSVPLGHALALRVRHLNKPFRRRVAKVTIERVRMRGTSQRATLCARRLWRWRERRVVVIAHVKSIHETGTDVNTIKLFLARIWKTGQSIQARRTFVRGKARGLKSRATCTHKKHARPRPRATPATPASQRRQRSRPLTFFCLCVC